MDIRSIGNPAQASPGISDRNIPQVDSSAASKVIAMPVETDVAVEQPKAIPNMAQLAQAIKSINKAMADLSNGLEFSIDADSKRTVVKIVDQETKEVIRQIPSEETLQIAKALDQVSGLLIRQKA